VRQLPFLAIAVCALAVPSEAHNPFPDGQVLQTRETLPDGDGQFERVRLLTTTFQYPLVRLEERIRLDAAGQELDVGTSIMVGNQLLVSLKPGRGRVDLSGRARITPRFGGR